MRSSSVAVVAAAVCAGLTATCEDQRLPMESQSRGLTFQVSGVGGANGTPISEQLELTLAFEGPGESRLAPSATIKGQIFAVHLQQSFDAIGRVVTLQASIENLSPHDVWRPLRVKVLAIKPSSASILSADNGMEGVGAKWDYGQTTGLDGKLVPGKVSPPRTIQVQVQGQDEASLHSLRGTVEVDGTVDPIIQPSPGRDVTLAEAAMGFDAGVVLVRYRAGILSPAELGSLNLRFGLAGQDYADVLGGYIAFAENPDFDATRTLQDLLSQDPAVQDVSLAPIAQASLIESPPDPHLALGNFPTAWQEDAARGKAPGEGDTVGLMDTGIKELDALKGEIARAVDVRLISGCDVFGPINPLADPQDRDGHGTKLASSIVAAPNKGPVVGAAYGAKIISVKFASTFGAQMWDWVCALRYVANHPEITVLNISWNSYTADDRPLGLFPSAATVWLANAWIKTISTRGTLIVASTGNCFVQKVAWPADRGEVIAVGGTDNVDGSKPWHQNFSVPPYCTTLFGSGTEAGTSYGPEVATVAPAQNLDVLDLNGNVDPTATGTSIAAPQATAVAAILKARNPNLKGSALRDEVLRHTVNRPPSGRDEFFGFGRIVAALPVNSVVLTPATASLQGGQTVQLTATLKDIDGMVLSGRSINWSSSNNSIARVDQTGLVTAIAPGPATITATSEGQRGTSSVVVSVGVSGGAWTTKAPMLFGRAGFAIGVGNGVLYAAGGYGVPGGGLSLSEVDAYDPPTDTWMERRAMPTPRFYLGSGVANGILYAVGGQTFSGSAGIVSTLEAYDPATDTWTSKAPMPTAREHLAVGVVNGILYTVGGFNSTSGALATLEAYDPGTDTWTTNASMFTPRYGRDVAVINGTLYAVGGFASFSSATGLWSTSTTLEAYDPATDTWTTKAPMPTARADLAAAMVNGTLYAVGGFADASHQAVDSLEAYDPATDTWTRMISMPTARNQLAAGAVNGILYAVGGYNPAVGVLATVEALDPAALSATLAPASSR